MKSQGGEDEIPLSELMVLDGLDQPWVEDEVIEHAHLDFVAMDLDIVLDDLDDGEKFQEGEEELAHMELDTIMVRLCGRGKDDRKQNNLEKTQDDQEDIFNWMAYYGGGTWWLDRWITIPEQIVSNISTTGE